MPMQASNYTSPYPQFTVGLVMFDVFVCWCLGPNQPRKWCQTYFSFLISRTNNIMDYSENVMWSNNSSVIYTVSVRLCGVWGMWWLRAGFMCVCHSANAHTHILCVKGTNMDAWRGMQNVCFCPCCHYFNNFQLDGKKKGYWSILKMWWLQWCFLLLIHGPTLNRVHVTNDGAPSQLLLQNNIFPTAGI